MTPRHESPYWPTLPVALLIGLAAGCASDRPASKDPGKLSVADFAKRPPTTSAHNPAHTPPRQVPQQPAVDPTPIDTPEPPAIDSNDRPTALRPAVAGDAKYTVDAMVGHVNGQPIYATAALEPIREQLAALGKRQTADEFRQRATQLIHGRLRQLVVDALILGEAERDLSKQEQAGLAKLLAERREEFVRMWGKGSAVVAEDNLARETGRSLDQTVAEARQRILVQRYLHKTLFPKINITRKNVERYYNDRLDEYNPPPTRTLRLIRTPDPIAATSIDTMLKIGAPFAEVAATEANTYRPDQDGLMSERAVGNSVFGSSALNAALSQLRPGEHSARIKDGKAFWWIYVESHLNQPRRSLREVQLEIEELLRRRRFQELTQDYRRTLIETGSYSSIEQMGQTLLDVAMARFAASPSP